MKHLFIRYWKNPNFAATTILIGQKREGKNSRTLDTLLDSPIEINHLPLNDRSHPVPLSLKRSVGKKLLREVSEQCSYSLK
jgi:hypothetical protein